MDPDLELEDEVRWCCEFLSQTSGFGFRVFRACRVFRVFRVFLFFFCLLGFRVAFLPFFDSRSPDEVPKRGAVIFVPLCPWFWFKVPSESNQLPKRVPLF